MYELHLSSVNNKVTNKGMRWGDGYGWKEVYN
jgi:hypothetical protein